MRNEVLSFKREGGNDLGQAGITGIVHCGGMAKSG